MSFIVKPGVTVMNNISVTEALDSLDTDHQEMLKNKPWFQTMYGRIPNIHILGNEKDSRLYIAIGFKGIFKSDPNQLVRDYIVMPFEIQHEPNTKISFIKILQLLAESPLRNRAYIDGIMETKQIAQGQTIMDVIIDVLRKTTFTDEFTLDDFVLAFIEHMNNLKKPNSAEHIKTAKVDFEKIMLDADVVNERIISYIMNEKKSIPSYYILIIIYISMFLLYWGLRPQ